jgi:hypothetical protein
MTSKSRPQSLRDVQCPLCKSFPFNDCVSEITKRFTQVHFVRYGELEKQQRIWDGKETAL